MFKFLMFSLVFTLVASPLIAGAQAAAPAVDRCELLIGQFACKPENVSIGIARNADGSLKVLVGGGGGDFITDGEIHPATWPGSFKTEYRASCSATGRLSIIQYFQGALNGMMEGSVQGHALIWKAGKNSLNCQRL